MTHNGPTEMLAHEEELLGRPVQYRNAFETTFRDAVGVERKLSLILYDTTLELGEIVQADTRYGIYVDGKQRNGGIV